MARVLHVTTIADSLVFLAGQAAYMRARGHELLIITSPDPQLRKFGEQEGVETYSVSMTRAITPRTDARSLGELTTLIRRLQPDIVHSHTPKGGFLGMLAARLAGTRVRLYHMRGLRLMTAQGANRVLLTQVERTSCLLATKVFCVSHSLRRVALDMKLCSGAKISVLGSGSGQGVDAEVRFNPARVSREARNEVRARLGIDLDAPVIGFVGRLVRDKGVGELVSAWQGLRSKYSALHLVLVGEFEVQDAVDPDTRRILEADERVHLVGFRRDTPSFYQAFDLVVLPTYREGFPNVPLEAAAMERPVVATRIPGCVDAVADGLTGTLVEPRDAKALERAISLYLDDADLRMSHGSKGRERVLAEFAREAIWAQLAAAYDAELERSSLR